MATINLGAIKFNWKGAYNNATAYAVDDVVSSGGSSYVCILASQGNAVSNGTYWNIMSSAGTNGTNGTNGTDVGTVITTQGDILYRDGSGLQRLGAGTAGQLLKTGGSGANPSWHTQTAGGLIQFKHGQDNTIKSRTSDGYLDLATLTITPTSASSKILLHMQTAWGYASGGNSPSAVIYPERAISGGATTQLAQEAVPAGYSNIGGVSSTENNNFGAEHIQSMSGQYVDATHNTTSAITYTLKFFVADGGSRTIYVGCSGQSTTNATYSARVPHIITAMEIGV
jgi:hypothetical protein